MLAPLHVVGGLRCSFIVDTVEENVALGEELARRFAVARSKNSHQRGNRSYADRKLNLVVPLGEGRGAGAVQYLCEVQILMRRYIEIKKIGHLLYEFER